MFEFLTSLSLQSGALLVSLISAAALIITIRFLPIWVQWCTGVTAPLLLAWSLYWAPVWLGADPSEYSAWSWLGVGVWATAGLLANTLIAAIASNRRRRRKLGGA